MSKGRVKKEFDLLSGTLNLFGYKIDLEELLASPENLKGRLEGLREKLKAVGGKEVISGEDWSQGGLNITGYIRTRGPLGEREFHVGTMGGADKGTERHGAVPEEVLEPPVDVFWEGEGVTIVADVPGVAVEDLDLKVKDNILYLSTKLTARRKYYKEVRLERDLEPESLKATCRNGVLEIHLRQQKSNKSKRAASRETGK